MTEREASMISLFESRSPEIVAEAIAKSPLATAKRFDVANRSSCRRLRFGAGQHELRGPPEDDSFLTDPERRLLSITVDASSDDSLRRGPM